MLVLTVHAPHFFEAAESSERIQAGHDLTAAHHQPDDLTVTDCPLPDAALPVLQHGVEDTAVSPLVFALSPVLLAFDTVATRLAPLPDIRPPGPTRHAILQRFIL